MTRDEVTRRMMPRVRTRERGDRKLPYSLASGEWTAATGGAGMNEHVGRAASGRRARDLANAAPDIWADSLSKAEPRGQGTRSSTRSSVQQNRGDGSLGCQR